MIIFKRNTATTVVSLEKGILQEKYTKLRLKLQSNRKAKMLQQETLPDKLDSFLPRFDLNGSQVDIIDAPRNFYSRLISMIQRAKTRIFLSSMYISKDAFGLVNFHAQLALKQESYLANL
jgi:phosphatidylserine/phosphatidylglycerophosphate/cardiolipin synthase-like enzyme